MSYEKAQMAAVVFLLFATSAFSQSTGAVREMPKAARTVYYEDTDLDGTFDVWEDADSGPLRPGAESVRERDFPRNVGDAIEPEE